MAVEGKKRSSDQSIESKDDFKKREEEEQYLKYKKQLHEEIQLQRDYYLLAPIHYAIIISLTFILLGSITLLLMTYHPMSKGIAHYLINLFV